MQQRDCEPGPEGDQERERARLQEAPPHRSVSRSRRRSCQRMKAEKTSSGSALERRTGSISSAPNVSASSASRRSFASRRSLDLAPRESHRFLQRKQESGHGGERLLPGRVLDDHRDEVPAERQCRRATPPDREGRGSRRGRTRRSPAGTSARARSRWRSDRRRPSCGRRVGRARQLGLANGAPRSRGGSAGASAGRARRRSRGIRDTPARPARSRRSSAPRRRRPPACAARAARPGRGSSTGAGRPRARRAGGPRRSARGR